MQAVRFTALGCARDRLCKIPHSVVRECQNSKSANLFSLFVAAPKSRTTHTSESCALYSESASGVSSGGSHQHFLVLRTGCELAGFLWMLERTSSISDQVDRSGQSALNQSGSQSLRSKGLLLSGPSQRSIAHLSKIRECMPLKSVISHWH